MPKALIDAVFRFDSTKINPWIALRNTIGVAVPLAIGVATNNVGAGVVAASGALNVSFSDSAETYRERARRMVLASLLVALGVFVGAATGWSAVMTVTVATVWAFAAGMMVALDQSAADLGSVSLVTLVVFASRPMPPMQAFLAGLMALGGGLFQTSLSLALWPVRRYQLERRSLRELYLELARFTEMPLQPLEAPPASGQSTKSQQALSALNRDHAVEAERLLALLSQAERMRLSLLALMRSRIRLERESPDSREGHILQSLFQSAAVVLRAVADALISGQTPPAMDLRDVNDAADWLRAANNAIAGDAAFQIDALAGQLRAALDLASRASPAGHTEFARAEARKPRRLQLGSTVAILLANLSLRSTACRHALRLAACIAIGDSIGHVADLQRSYWLPMTIAIILKPDFTTTFSRGVLRLSGTLVGLLLATGLFHFLHTSAAGDVVLIVPVMFLMRCFGPANYGVFATFVTGMVVLLVAITGVPPQQVMLARGINTTAGGVLALIAYWLWPTWERTVVAEVLARLLDCYRDYFRVVRNAYQHPESRLDRELDAARLGGRLARSNVQASVDRIASEPGTPAQVLQSLGAILATTHRLAHALMAMEAGLLTSRPAPPRPTFKKFADDVELTLYYLAAALRGSPVTRTDVPDLRADHRALVHTAHAEADRYTLINAETDRITNTLNTLSEQILRLVGADPQRDQEGAELLH
ncbi:MAG TPA: FUSC family protein [Bryobacteraceae bacterium]|nr:FUSC family protein [Bryobacteraceae bacterium]